MERAQGISALEGTTCLELALEGERLCKTGDIKNGVRFFEEAIKQGTRDIRIKSAIHSQLGNAYFYLEDYQRAIEHHKKDVNLVHSIGDEAAEAKAYGNLGNTYKMLGKFDEAAIHCRRQLEISRKLNDKVSEARALYNLGNVYYTQGKRMMGTIEQETCQLSGDAKLSLQRAAEYYESNLKVVSQLKDYEAMGRAYGNLGNMYYILGSFDKAIDNHQRRLQLAIQIGDKPAERRARLNLGNANIFLCRYRDAIESYSATMKLAQELGDTRTEAHACYSLASSHILLHDFTSSIDHYLRYLEIMTDLGDTLGEELACVSLLNVYRMVGDFESALIFAHKQSNIAAMLGDETSMATAKASIEELQEIVERRSTTQESFNKSSQLCDRSLSTTRFDATDGDVRHSPTCRLTTGKRLEHEHELSKIHHNPVTDPDANGSSEDSLLDKIETLQNDRFDDQRSELKSFKTTDSFCDCSMITTSCHSENREDQCSSVSNSRSQRFDYSNLAEQSAKKSSILQASNPVGPMGRTQQVASPCTTPKSCYRNLALNLRPVSAALPDRIVRRQPDVDVHQDRLLDLIEGVQSQRMDEQRASPPDLVSFKKKHGLDLQPASAENQNQSTQPSALFKATHEIASKLFAPKQNLPAPKPQSSLSPHKRQHSKVEDDLFTALTRVASTPKPSYNATNDLINHVFHMPQPTSLAPSSTIKIPSEHSSIDLIELSSIEDNKDSRVSTRTVTYAKSENINPTCTGFHLRRPSRVAPSPPSTLNRNGSNSDRSLRRSYI